MEVNNLITRQAPFPFGKGGGIGPFSPAGRGGQADREGPGPGGECGRDGGLEYREFQAIFVDSPGMSSVNIVRELRGAELKLLLSS